VLEQVPAAVVAVAAAAVVVGVGDLFPLLHTGSVCSNKALASVYLFGSTLIVLLVMRKRRQK
jgi:hypothetical protein